jgi:DnaJ-class molecular chaperone
MEQSPCQYCNGTATMQWLTQMGGRLRVQSQPCAECFGLGWFAVPVPQPVASNDNAVL